MPEIFKAYEDISFLKKDVCRAVRLQLEFLRPDTVMEENGIESTLVLFGSARTPAPEDAEAELAAAREAVAADPTCADSRRRLQRAECMLEQSHYYGVARDLARLVSDACQRDQRCSMVIVTGGGGGIMEAGNRGAADADAPSIGLNISLPYEQAPNPYISDQLCFEFHYFSIRKMHLLLRAKALCAFPGGFGTMDELFETLTLIQTGKIPRMPIVLFGRAFWEELINWDLFVQRGLICSEDLDLFRYCETADEAWAYISTFACDCEGIR